MILDLKLGGVRISAKLTVERADPDVGWSECKYVDDLDVSIIDMDACSDEWETTDQKQLEAAVLAHIERNFDRYTSSDIEQSSLTFEYMD